MSRDDPNTILNTVSCGTAEVTPLGESHRNRRVDRPDVIVVDAVGCTSDGHALVRAVKSDPLTRRIPVIAMVEKSSDDALSSWYDVRVNGCIGRPESPAALVETLLTIEGFWRNTAILPRR